MNDEDAPDHARESLKAELMELVKWAIAYEHAKKTQSMPGQLAQPDVDKWAEEANAAIDAVLDIRFDAPAPRRVSNPETTERRKIQTLAFIDIFPPNEFAELMDAEVFLRGSGLLPPRRYPTEEEAAAKLRAAQRNRRPWFWKPEWYWAGWKTLFPLLVGHDEYARRTLVVGWPFTGRIVFPTWVCGHDDCVDDAISEVCDTPIRGETNG